MSGTASVHGPHILALHGVPTSPVLWSRLSIPMETPALSGTLARQVAQALPLVTPETVILGHDMGGVVAAIVALVARPRGVVLSGTALGPYWTAVRTTAWPGLWRYFYARHAGRRFVAGAVSAQLRGEALAAFPGADPVDMRGVARSMRPPPGLAQQLAARTRVELIWGRDDPWYPPLIARRLSAVTGAPLAWVDGGHFSMWEAPEAFERCVDTALTRLTSEPR